MLPPVLLPKFGKLFKVSLNISDKKAIINLYYNDEERGLIRELCFWKI